MILIEILAVLFLTLINGVLAMSELAIVSSRKSRLENMAIQGSHGARAAVRLLNDPSRFLSTVQIGITLVGIFAGAFSGATLGHHLGNWLDRFLLISPHGYAVGIGLTVAAITYLSLVLGELLPKRIALSNPERIASFVSRPMIVLSFVAAPAVWMLQHTIEMILHLLKFSESPKTSVTEDEVKLLIAEGTQSGIFVPQEKEMIEGVLHLADRPVRVIMTPRSEIAWIDIKSGWDKIKEITRSNRVSRLLVCDGTIDQPIGFIHSKSLLSAVLSEGNLDLSKLTFPLLFVPDGASVLSLLNRIKKEHLHIAVVVDEYGATEGLVTLTDVLESIAGDLPERGEDMESRIVQRDDGTWLMDGTLPTDEIETYTGINLGREVKTLASFILQYLKTIPRPGMSFDYENTRFEILDMDGNRIDKVLVEIKQKYSEIDDVKDS